MSGNTLQRSGLPIVMSLEHRGNVFYFGVCKYLICERIPCTYIICYKILAGPVFKTNRFYKKFTVILLIFPKYYFVRELSKITVYMILFYNYCLPTHLMFLYFMLIRWRFRGSWQVKNLVSKFWAITIIAITCSIPFCSIPFSNFLKLCYDRIYKYDLLYFD